MSPAVPVPPATACPFGCEQPLPSKKDDTTIWIVCFLAGLARIAGYYYVLGYQSTTLFNVGVGVMVFACLLKLEEMAARHRE